MAWLISALGAALALGGAISLGYGSYYIRLDWGQAETVAGTVALAGGLVVVALGAVLLALRDLARRPVRAAPAGVGFEALTGGGRDEPVPRPGLSRLKGRLATVGMPQGEPGVPAAPSAEPPPRLAAEPDREPEPVAAPRPAAVSIDAPTVVGRYEANGASYVLFSDGTIEVETENGTHRFASMADLKAHIERQDAI